MEWTKAWEEAVNGEAPIPRGLGGCSAKCAKCAGRRQREGRGASRTCRRGRVGKRTPQGAEVRGSRTLDIERGLLGARTPCCVLETRAGAAIVVRRWFTTVLLWPEPGEPDTPVIRSSRAEMN